MFIQLVQTNKEAVMHVMGRIGFMGLGIALAGCLSGTPVFAGDKPAAAPVADGSTDHAAPVETVNAPFNVTTELFEQTV